MSIENQLTALFQREAYSPGNILPSSGHRSHSNKTKVFHFNKIKFLVSKMKKVLCTTFYIQK